jgi:hypothetical protein
MKLRYWHTHGWSPNQKDLIHDIEMVQRRAARYLTTGTTGWTVGNLGAEKSKVTGGNGLQDYEQFDLHPGQSASSYNRQNKRTFIEISTDRDYRANYYKYSFSHH